MSVTSSTLTVNSELQEQLREPVQLVASDQRLLTAARNEGLATLDVRS